MRRMIAIPAYNEIHVSRIAHEVCGLADRVVVVDDGSQPPLEVDAPAHVHRLSENRGYGDVVQEAIAIARAEGFDQLALVDGDAQHDPAHLAPLFSMLDFFDIAVGDRTHPTSPVKGVPQPEARRLVNQLFVALMRRLVSTSVPSDLFSGFIALRVASVPSSLDLRASGYASPLRFWPCVLGAKLAFGQRPIPRIYHKKDALPVSYPTLADALRHLTFEFMRAMNRDLDVSPEQFLLAVSEVLDRRSYGALDAIMRQVHDWLLDEHERLP